MKAVLDFFLVIFLFSMITEESSAKEGSTEGDASVDNTFLTEVAKNREYSGNKVTIVGAGNVGTAVAFSLITQYVTDEIVLIDRDENRVKGEVKDLQEGTVFIRSPKIYGGKDYALSKNSKICIITAGLNQSPGQRRDDLIEQNYEIFKTIIPELIEHNPNAVILVVTNPVDIMTYITWKLVGEQNTYKIIGSGTNLDSSRLRFLVSQELHISPESVGGWVIGGHGDDSVTVWSGVNVAGVNLKRLDENLSSKMKAGENGETWYAKIDKRIVDSAMDIINLKGKTSWAVSLSVANIAYSILHNVPNIHAVSTMVKGFHGIEDNIFLSLPCVLGENGVTHIIKQPLEEDELRKLQKMARNMIDKINLLNEGDKNQQ